MEKPKGELAIQTIAMPKDTNANGDIFGGWLLSQMDLASGILGKQLSKGRVATVAINSMSFMKPVHVGDIVSCHAQLEKTGTTSMTINVEVWINSLDDKDYQVTSGTFVVVAIDDNGRPRPLPKTS